MQHPGSSKEALFRLRHQDGSWRWMEGVITNLLDEPAVQSLVINYRDITERKLAEQEIASMAKFPSENPNPLLRLSQDGIVMYANTASVALLQMWGSGVGEPALGSGVSWFLKGSQAWKIKLLISSVRGRFTRCSSLRLPRQVTWMFTGATSPNASWQRLNASRVRLSSGRCSSSHLDSIVLIDPHDPQVSWPIIDCNKAACQISGSGRDELIGQSIDILNVTPGTLAERTAYRYQLREAGNLNYEVAHRHKDGTVFPVEVLQRSLQSVGVSWFWGSTATLPHASWQKKLCD